jgi:hypothetical protein
LRASGIVPADIKENEMPYVYILVKENEVSNSSLRQVGKSVRKVLTSMLNLEDRDILIEYRYVGPLDENQSDLKVTVKSIRFAHLSQKKLDRIRVCIGVQIKGASVALHNFVETHEVYISIDPILNSSFGRA